MVMVVTVGYYVPFAFTYLVLDVKDHVENSTVYACRGFVRVVRS